MNKKIIGIASVSIVSLLAVLIVSENNEFETITTDLPTLEIPSDISSSEMSQTFEAEAKYKPENGIITIFYKDKSMGTDKLIIEVWGLPQTYHKEFECDIGALAENAKHENVCPDIVTANIKLDFIPKYGWESIPVVFTVDHNEFGKISIKTEIYETGDPKPRVIYSSI
tara:strand:- start:43 stop:549 length:507 start_codon:yes stop_codon:yes gene_type:complete